MQFESDWTWGDAIYGTALSITNPVATFQPQGRYTDTYQVNNNASLMLGSHSLQMGGSWQRNRINPYNFAGRFPTVSFGFSAAAPAAVQMNTSQFPGGISATDISRARATAAWLGGIVSSVSQTYQVESKTSGYVPGIPSNEFYTLDNIAAYIQDNWRWKPNFTVRAGLKWEYYSPIREDNDLGLLPVLNNRPFRDVMLDPMSTLSFANGSFWTKDLNNFGPTAGFAWDVTNDGRTAVRGGYSLTFVNEESVTVGRSVGRSNSGLTTAVNLTNQYATVSGGIPLPATPAFLTERTLADQMALSAIAVFWGLDPNLKAPHVHQVSVGIQRELGWASALEARYVGTFGRGIWRGIDLNQIQISPEFRADFDRARTNGYLAQQAGLAFSPVFNPNVSGSQPLTVLPSFGLLTNATAVGHIQTNQVAGLADFYIQSRVQGALATFMQNPAIYAVDVIENGGFSDYHALQLEFRRQLRGGLLAGINYTFSDTSTNSVGTGQNRFEAFMDNARPQLNTGRSLFHVTHVMTANTIYELPFGGGRRWANRSRIADAVLGGWQLSSLFAWQSGSPISITSARGTFNRPGRSDCGTPTVCNTAVSTLSDAEIKKLIGLHKVEDRIYWIDPKVINASTGRAVGADNLGNTAGFDGQVFFNPGAGDVGNLSILRFDGPSQFRIDVAVSKRFRFVDRYGLKIQGEAFNLTNTPSFFIADMNINSTTFGRITSVNVDSRVVQLSARFDF